MISVLILTKNEETNIAKCLASVNWSDDIVVYDSYSDDATPFIAQEHGARVVQREFDNWSSHQNWAVNNIDFKHPWVFYLDADEECDQTLKTELASIDDRQAKFAAFRVRRKDYFMGQWLRRSQLYPTWIVRVFRPERIRYERLVNPVAIVDGETGTLQGHIEHSPFSHGVAHWFDRHNRYSDFEARDLLRDTANSIQWNAIWSRDANARRRELKRLAYKMPGRPVWMLFYLLIFRLGFLDGLAGVYYSMMRAAYELMIDVKVSELKWRQDRESQTTRPNIPTECHSGVDGDNHDS